MGQISAIRTSIKEAWNSVSERTTLGRPRASAAPAARGASSEATVKADSSPGGEETTLTIPSAPAPPAREALSEARAVSPPPRLNDSPGTAVDQSPRAPAKGCQIVIARRATIADLAVKAYGGFNVLAIDLIKEGNPHIDDLNSLRPRERLRLPSLDAEALIRRQPDDRYSLILGSFLSPQAAERARDRLRRGGYESTITTRRVTDTLEVHRVALRGLETPEVAQRAWKVAWANCWAQTELPSSPRAGISKAPSPAKSCRATSAPTVPPRACAA